MKKGDSLVFLARLFNIGEAGVSTGSMNDVISSLNTGISSSTIFGTFVDMIPWIITLVIASFAIFELRKLIKGASKGKVRV